MRHPLFSALYCQLNVGATSLQVKANCQGIHGTVAKNIDIIEAALECFAKYGIKRTTMADIASSADVSRQTVYAHFGTKEDIIHDAILTLTQRHLEEIDAIAHGAMTLQEKLDGFFEVAIFKPYDMMMTYPDMADLLNSHDPICKTAHTKARDLKCHFFENIFTPYADLLASKGQTVQQFAQFVGTTALQMKWAANSKEHLHELIASLRAVIICCLNCDHC